MTLSVEAATVEDIGTYILEVIETDTLTGFKAFTQVNLAVLSPLT